MLKQMGIMSDTSINGKEALFERTTGNFGATTLNGLMIQLQNATKPINNEEIITIIEKANSEYIMIVEELKTVKFERNING